MEQEFAGRTALITGAASGIGAASVRWLEARGIGELILVDIDAAGLESLETACQTQRLPGDVGDPALWERIEPCLARLDHAVINAGIANGGPLTDLDFAEWRRIMSVNLDGAFLALRTALRAMRKGSGGSVVLTSSVVGVKPVGYTHAYGSSKAAVVQLAKIAAAEHLGGGIRVNAIAPGRVDTAIWTKTERFAELLAEHGDRDRALVALGEETGGNRYPFTSAEAIARQIGFLLSDACANVTGTVLVSDGGYSL